MTREEAIKTLEALLIRADITDVYGDMEDMTPYEDAVNMAIQALEQEPSGDAISREGANKFLYERIERLNDDELYDIFSKIIDDMYNELPSINPAPSGDAVSREALKHKLQEHHDFFVNAYGGFNNLPQNDKSRVDEILNCIAMVVNEPSVKPQEPCDVFDEYGNYKYPSDVELTEPNTATSMPSVNPQESKWIPTSERLPQINEWVLCQCRTGYKVLRLTSYRCYHNDTQEYMDSFVIAWMPLPKPYEPTCDTCEYNTATFNPCNACKDKSEYKSQESEDTNG